MIDADVIEIKVNGEDIFQLVQRIEDVMGDAPRAHGVIAALSVAITLQDPTISADKLHDAVKGASEWICLYLAGNESVGLAKEQLN